MIKKRYKDRLRRPKMTKEQLLKQIAYDYGLPESDLIKRYGKEILS